MSRTRSARRPPRHPRRPLARRTRCALPLLLVPLLLPLLMPLLAAPPAAAATGAAHRRGSHAVCTRPHRGFAHCDAVLATDGVRPLVSPTPAGLTPADVQGAYGLPADGGAGRTVAIVDAYDDPAAAADLAVYRATFGLPPCGTGDGCLRVVGGDGTSRLPTPNAGWAEEESLDLDAVSAACPACRLLLVEARSSSIADLLAAERTALAAPGVVAVSNSWGGGEPAGAATETAFRSATVEVTASSGDSGYGVEFPASSADVLAVGGTSLTVGPDHRRVRETAWSLAGSGCSASVPKPGWQRDRSCTRRSVADVAADADPATGLAVYDSYGLAGGGGWLVVGGTSLAAPLVAAVHAVAGSTGSTVRQLYAGTAAVHDITTGHNGSCRARALCTSGPGWDGPTGVGSPDGPTGW